MNDTISIQVLNHKFFHYAPSLSQLTSNAEDKILIPFLKYIENKNISLDWRGHLYLLKWLSTENTFVDQLTLTIQKELLRASLILWSLQGLEHLEFAGNVISSPWLPNAIMGLWKTTEVYESPQIFLVKRTAVKNNITQFALIPDRGRLENLDWMPIEN